MTSKTELLTADEMRQRYGSFYDSSPRIRLDKRKVPQKFWALIPYAEFWGVSDDWTRGDLLQAAPADARENLRRVVAEFDNPLDEWLAGPEADERTPSIEYVAFSAMRIAGYSA